MRVKESMKMIIRGSGLSYARVGKIIDKTPQNISNQIEHGNMKISLIMEIAKCCGYDVCLVKGNDNIRLDEL